MTYISFLSRRYLRASRANRFVAFIVLIAVTGVMLGTAALDIALSVIAGFERQLQGSIVAFTAEIEAQGFQHIPLPDYRSAIRVMRDSVPGIRAIAPYAAHEVIIRSHAGIEGMILKGLDTSQSVSTIPQRIVAGTYVLSDPAHGHGCATIVIGKRLAEKLETGVGDTVFVFTLSGVPSPLNPARVDKLIVGGLYETGFSDYDELYAYVALPVAQQMFSVPPANVTGFDIMTDGSAPLSSIAARIEQTMGYPYDVQTMYDLYPSIFAWINLQKLLVPVVISLIIIVAAFNIVATLLMIVLEKTHSIGILKTLGAGAGAVRKIFVRQGAVIGAAGVVLGNMLGVALCWIQQTTHVIALKSDVYFMSWAPIHMQASSFVLVSIIAFALCMFATYLPARIASRLAPLDALRFG